MSFKSWWEERKRLQEEREARRYELEEGADDEVWVDPEEPEEAAVVEDDVPAAEEEASEPEPASDDEAPAADETPPVYAESWWKRRLLGGPEEPVAEAAEPETQPEDAEPEEPEEAEPEPVDKEPFDKEPFDEEPVYEELVDEVEDPVAEVLYEEPGSGEPAYSYPDEDELFDDEIPVQPEVDADAAAPVGGDVPGPRRARLEGERRAKRRKELLRGGIAAALAAVVGLVGVIAIMGRDEAPAPAPGLAAKGPDAEDTITTTLVFGTKEQRAGAAPTWIALLSTDSATGRCSVTYIPAHTATGVPGRGLLAIGDALESGGVPLLLLAAETLLGTPVDRYLELSDADAAVLFEEIGPLTVDVPDDVRVEAGPGQARLLFTAGPQRLSAGFLADLLYVKGLDTDDVELGGRHIALWAALLEAFTFDAEGLGAAVESAGAALGESDASIQELARLFERLAAAAPEDRTLALLPVRQIGVGGSELYQVDEDEVKKYLARAVGAQAVAGREVRIQILNGNGSPGVGQLVAERLGGEGFRVILSGNARRLNYRQTLVITYDRTSKALDLAERTRDLIGVGEVQVGAQSQGIVDLTIVVGKDFLQTL
ncbi:MAG TPA: LCP family protein [Actinomycetota bacterium]|nr:LCP family protein [Actinomycetota bacterium]